MKYILKGGTVVGGSVSQRADLLIDGEKIAAVGENLCVEGAQVVDVTGKLLFPGFIDAHTHFDLDVCNTTTADDFTSGTRSAICGGTTMVIDFACPNKGETLGYGLSLWHKKADGKSSCDYGFHMTIDDWNEGIRAEIPQMFEAGIPSFKMYMTYPAMMIGDQDLFSALLELKKYGGIAGVHCENAGVIDALIAQHKKDGKLAPASHPECRPNPLEAEAVAHLLRIAEVADVPVVIVHLSTKEALAEVMTARARGQKVYVETCPHYLLLDDSLYRQPEFIDSAQYICAPPLRTKADQELLWRALANGTIQTSRPTIAALRSARRTPDGTISRRSPAACPVWRRAACCFTPRALRRGASRRSRCVRCWPRIRRSSTEPIRARACFRRAATPISWSTIRRRI